MTVQSAITKTTIAVKTTMKMTIKTITQDTLVTIMRLNRFKEILKFTKRKRLSPSLKIKTLNFLN